MKEENPIKPLIEQLGELLAYCEKELQNPTPSSKELPKDTRAKVENLELQINLFKEVLEETLEDKEVLEKKILLTQRDLRDLERLKEFEKEVFAKRRALSPFLRAVKQREETVKKKVVSRKKKFRGLNPRGKWKRL